MENSFDRAAEIAALNDRFRRTFTGGEVVLTAGVRALAASGSLIPLFKAVQTHVPEAGNDPYGERDFGSLPFAGTTIFWKIDYYDLDRHGLSPDPADPSVTCRVLTIMHADEY
ncbi:MAG: DUF3768 domain-containing protein [Rhodomicrobiaceae bacterium]